MGSAGSSRVPLRRIGCHEGLPLRQGEPGCSILIVRCREMSGWPSVSSNSSVRSGSLFLARSLAVGAHGDSRLGPGDREPPVPLGTRPVRRDPAYHHERRTGPPHGIRRVWPDGSDAARLNSLYRLGLQLQPVCSGTLDGTAGPAQLTNGADLPDLIDSGAVG